MTTEHSPQRPTIARNPVAVESASDKGYTPETSLDANIDANALAELLVSLDCKLRLDTITLCKVRDYCNTVGLDYTTTYYALKDAIQ